MITELQKAKKRKAKRSTTQETESVGKKTRQPVARTQMPHELAKYRSDLGRNGIWDPCLVSTLAPSG